jgi:iron complex outermembrane receptor protein
MKVLTRQNRHVRRLVALGGVSALALTAAPVWAQDSAQAAEEEFADDAIIVTATKRETTLQEIPVAVSVTMGETIERAQIRDLKDLSSVVPSLRVNTLQSSANTNFVIRGFGNGANNAGIEPSVGLFVDGVYRSRSAAMIADLPDVQRVEVLRGPQSTLFGKNASAGIISIRTKKPEFEFGGNIEATYGNFNAMTLKGVVTGPLSDTIAFSLGGAVNKRDGYTRDLGPAGGRSDERDRWSVRGQLLFEPNDGLEIKLIGDFGKIDEVCCSVVNLRQSSSTLAIIAPAPVGLGGKIPDFRKPFADVIYSNFPSENDIENWGIQGQVDYDFGNVKLTSITGYRGVRAITNQDSDFTSADLIRRPEDVDIKTFTQELRLDMDLGDSLKGMLGAFYFNEKVKQEGGLFFGSDFRGYADRLIRGQSNNAFNLAAVEGLLGALQGNPALYAGKFFASGNGFDESYRLKNTAFSVYGQIDFEVTDRLTLTGGLNYTKDKKRFSTNTVSNEVFSAIPLANFVTPATQLFVAQGVGTAINSVAPGAVPTGIASAAQIASFAGGTPPFGSAASAAAYSSLIVPTATATAQGLLALRALQFLPPYQNVPNVAENGRVSDSNVAFTLSASYEVTDTTNVYLRYATGYKAASINLSRDARPTAPALAQLIAAGVAVPNLTSGSRFAGPEDSTVYELGLKGNWDWLSANVAVFKQEIKGFQSNLFTGTGFFLANAGKQSVKGIEFEGRLKPADPLTITFAATYLDSKYDSFLLSAFGDLSGTTVPGATPLSITFGGEHVTEFDNGNSLILRADYHYEAPFRLVEGLPNLVVKNPITGAVLDVAPALAAAKEFRQSVNDLNASITYTLEMGLEFSIWGRNLLDDRMIRQIFDSPAQIGSISGYPNQPRTYGASVRYRF